MTISALLTRHELDIGIQTHAMLRRGWVLTEIKDNKLYKGKADTFAEYISQADVRADAKCCMELYDFYIVQHKLPAENIQDIHYKRLLEAKKAITLEPDKLNEWIDDCRALSWKDLINAVRGVRGRAEMPTSKSTTDEPPASDSPSPCCICGATPAENAHWPITDKMGGLFTIPLCRGCHNEYHAKGDGTFYKNYKHKIGEYLYNSIQRRETNV